MTQAIGERVSVIASYDSRLGVLSPVKMRWNGRVYPLQKLGLHHMYRQGRVLKHVFSVAGSQLFFRLVLDTESLSWTLEEVSDGEAN